MDFKITNGKGFHLTFSSGYTVSVQWGWGNYCGNNGGGLSIPSGGLAAENVRLGEQGSTTAEVAVWGEDGEMLEIADMDSVIGWVTADDVARIIGFAAAGDVDSLTPFHQTVE